MKKINILHIYQNSKTGGVQLQLLNLLRAYNREIFHPIFCCLGPEEEISRELKRINVETIALKRVRYNRFSPGIVRDLYSLMNRKHIHIVRTHRYRANLYGRLAAFFSGVPVKIISIHDNYRKDLRLERRIVNKILSRVTDRIVAVSESIKKDILKYDKIDPFKVVVIHNGVDITKFNPEGKFHDIRKEFTISDNEIIIGFVGRLVPAKGLQYLIDAFSLLNRELKNIKLLIVGEGSLLDSLRESVQKNNINEKVIFTGKRHDIPDILSAIDLFIMPSIAEGLPNSLLEAMAMGKPIVATEIGGTPELIKNGFNGLLVPPRDPGALATAIKGLIYNGQLAAKIGFAARNFVLNNYNISEIVQKWQSLYLSILKEKGVMK